ncbi:hypothetical protein Sste5346_003922 [Sporothrix stenoceras]|uniref:Uncharacterized protein n=1 Tax=Sporothrix stenoceras TaxID=5173 RepID=A0ABR3ZAD7_9PEZI
MSYRRERELHSNMESATEYAKLYQRAQRAARNGSSFSPPASPTPAYEFTRQQTWPGQAHPPRSGAGSYEDRERGIPIRERQRDRGWDHTRDYDDREQEYDEEDEHEYDYDRHDDREWQPSGSPRTPRTAGMTSGGSSLGGSYGRREREIKRERERERERERDLERERDREKDRRVKEREQREREKARELKLEKERERQRDRDVYRQRMRYAAANYPRRLRTYLMPVLQNTQAMDHATDIFIKLDQDARYLTQSANTLLESLTAVAEDQATGGNGTGLDDPAPSTDGSSEDMTTTEESSALEDSETAAESMSSDSDSDDDEQQFGNFGPEPSFSSRRPSLVNGSSGRRRSSAGHRQSGSGADHQRKGSNSTTTGPTSTTGSAGGNGPPPLMNWTGFRPFALNRISNEKSVNDRRKSLMALTQIISVTLLASLGVDTGNNGGRASLSTRGLLAELLRVLQPKDYRAYFRASARVILLPEGSNILSRAQPPDEVALEGLERQLLGTAKFVPGVATSASSAPSPMMACLTYTSASHGTITLYRLDMSGSGGEGWPRRITPVSAMIAVPKELLRRTARSMPPSRRTVLKVAAVHTNGNDKKKEEKRGRGGRSASISEDKESSFDSKDDIEERERVRPRWVSIPQETVAPKLGYTSTVDAPALSTEFLSALGLGPEDGKLSDGTEVNTINATLPAMFAWLHVRAAYLTGMEMSGPEVQRATAPSVSKAERERERPEKTSPSKNRDRRDRDRGDRERERDRDRERDYDDNASTSTSTTAQPSRGRLRRIVRWQHGPTPMDHDGKEPTIVVLHPSRGDWVTSPVFWSMAKE